MKIRDTCGKRPIPTTVDRDFPVLVHTGCIMTTGISRSSSYKGLYRGVVRDMVSHLCTGGFPIIYSAYHNVV